ncbi:hypothetical protein [Catellatospora tritici]|uniref:hypothetical protein n=1 Tax=Catellatospora tritici TaxID=2851566 RepID=UPI001C2CDE03|nr:hypothetical protein [Catellatospora tritici]MBV1855095.1 hypothetical protein [Catellatospora tritici]
MQRLTKRLARSQSRPFTAYGVAVLTFGAALVAGTAFGQQAAQAEAKAKVSVDPASLGFTAAAFPRHACQLDFGGGPYVDQDVWVFKLPGEHAETGEFINVTAEFGTPEGDTTIVTIPADGGGTLLRANTDKAWAALPQGLTLVGATAEITGTADSFIVGRTCPASAEAPSPSPSASSAPSPTASPALLPSASPAPSPSASTAPPVAAGPLPLPSGSASPSASTSAAPGRPGGPSPRPSSSVSPSPRPSRSVSPSPRPVGPVSPSPRPSGSPSAAPIVLPPFQPAPSATTQPAPPAPPHARGFAVHADDNGSQWASGFTELWAQIAKIFG